MADDTRKPVLYVRNELPHFRLIYAPVTRIGPLQTAPGQGQDGYGRQIHSDYLLDPGNGQRRQRVYIAQISNAGTAYIKRADGEWLCLSDGDWPDRIRHGAGNRALAKWLTSVYTSQPIFKLARLKKLMSEAETDGELTIDRYFVLHVDRKPLALHFLGLPTLNAVTEFFEDTRRNSNNLAIAVFDCDKGCELRPVIQPITWEELKG